MGTLGGFAGSFGAPKIRTRRLGMIRFLPAVAAGVYPLFLRAFHLLVGPSASHITPPQFMGAAASLVAMVFVPALGMICAAIPAQAVSTRRLAYASVTAPTLYVFLGVVQSMAGSPLPDELVWCLLWLGAAVWAEAARRAERPAPLVAAPGRWRIAHGVAGAVILIYILFHIANHLFGLIGPEAHAAVMDLGRKVYRAPIVEPVLVLLLLFQIAIGLRLAWRWSAGTANFYRTFQVASGVYLSVFVLGHMNSVFLYARAYQHIPTDWAFAVGGPAGLIHDPWNIRLLPHYVLGVFFALTHLGSGLRAVLIAHGADGKTANRIWASCGVLSAVVATAVGAGLCGIRV